MHKPLKFRKVTRKQLISGYRFNHLFIADQSYFTTNKHTIKLSGKTAPVILAIIEQLIIGVLLNYRTAMLFPIFIPYIYQEY